jgi:hypothetical protein
MESLDMTDRDENPCHYRDPVQRERVKVALREQRNARHRLKALLLRNGMPYAGRSCWMGAHLR